MLVHLIMFSFHKFHTVTYPTKSYLQDLQLYQYYPEGTISYKELEIICMQRVEVLLLIEQLHKQTDIEQTISECKAILIDILKKNGYNLFAKIINGASKELKSDKDEIFQLRRQDHITHFILRAAFVSYERRWFHVQELRLFFWRLYTSTTEELKAFLRVNELRMHDISKEDEEDLKEYIKANNFFNGTSFYKVPFPLVIYLVETRKVFLKYGMAFVPEKELAEICFGHFKQNLALGLGTMPTVASAAADDARINKIFYKLTRYVKLQKTAMEKSGGPSLPELNDMSKISYPLCMRIIHEKLRENHHLTHGERCQYSLFLKSIGLTLNDAIELWKQEFTKIIDGEKFEAEYGYRLKHIYGQAGSQKTYKSYKCSRIISFDRSHTEFYGCPFKYLTDIPLKEKLSEYKIVPVDIEDIVKESSSGNYQEACKKYYEVMHNYDLSEIFYTPVYYFNKSQKRLRYINQTIQNNNSEL